MSHKRFHSQGSIPFSWEDKPGVSKITTPTELGLSFSSEDSSDLDNNHEIKIPLPPCPVLKAPSRSTSTKALKWQAEADPFLLAFKACTKSGSTSSKSASSGKFGSEKLMKKGGVGLIGYKVRKSKFNMFSCKSSCDARDDNYLNLSQLPPPLPRDRSRSSR